MLNLKQSAMLAFAGLMFCSSIAEAGIIRRAGSSSATAPARTGSTALVSDTVQLNDPFPAATAEYLVHDGDAPQVHVGFAGASKCDWFAETCWGEYLPGEHIVLEGAIYGGNTTLANLTFEFTIRDMTTFQVVHQYPESAPETSIDLFYPDYTTPGNPCVGVSFFATDSGGCQAFSIDVEVPTDLLVNTFYQAGWTARWNAPSGMHYVLTNTEDASSVVEEIRPFMESGSFYMPIMRLAPVPEAPVLPLLAFGIGLLYWRRRS